MKKNIDLLDRIDVKILNILQKECRISNVDLAKQIHLSPTPCLDRVRRLETNGFIDKYVAHLNPSKLDLNLTAYLEITLKSSNTADLDAFNRHVFLLDEVIECLLVAGGFDYLLKIRTKDMDSYRKFLGGKLALIESISNTHTYVVMEEIKSTHIIPVKIEN